MTAKSEYNTQKSYASARRRLEIPLQADWFTDPKFAALIQKEGYEAAGVVFALAGLLWRENDHIIEERELSAIAWTLHLEVGRLLEIIQAADEIGLLFLASNQIECPFITRAAEEMDARLGQLRENGRLGGRPKKPTANQLETCGFECETPANQTQSINQSVDINSSEGESKGGEPPHPLESQFQKVEPEIGTGRRPLKKYPKLRLTPGELETVLKRLDALGLASPQQKSFAFENAEAQAGKNPRGDCYCWLLSWATENAVSLLNEAQKLKRNGGSAPEKKHYKDLPPPPARPNGDLSRIGAVLPEVFAGGAK